MGGVHRGLPNFQNLTKGSVDDPQHTPYTLVSGHGTYQEYQCSNDWQTAAAPSDVELDMSVIARVRCSTEAHKPRLGLSVGKGSFASSYRARSCRAFYALLTYSAKATCLENMITYGLNSKSQAQNDRQGTNCTKVRSILTQRQIKIHCSIDSASTDGRGIRMDI